MYYGPEIIIQSGAEIQGINDKERLGILMNIPLAATNAFGSLIAIFIIDNLGRRFMLLRATPFIMLSLIGIALSMHEIIFSYEKKNQDIGRICFVISITLYLLFFSVGFSTTPWTVNSEIYPIHLIGTATALATATNWLSNFVVASVFLSSLESNAGKVFTFLILAFFALSALIFIYFLVPETAG